MKFEDPILKAALELFCENGIQGASTAKIAKKASVSNGSLFNRYPTKDALIFGLYEAIKKELNCALILEAEKVDCPKEKLRALYIQSLIWANANPLEFQYVMMFQSSHFSKLVDLEAAQKEAQYYIEPLLEAQKFDRVLEEPPQYLLMMMQSQIIGVHQYLSSEDRTPSEVEIIANQSFDLLWKMISR